MLQPNNAKNCPVCRLSFEHEGTNAPNQRGEDRASRKQSKYTRRMTGLYKEISFKWIEFNEEVNRAVFTGTLRRKPRLGLDSRIVTNPLDEVITSDIEVGHRLEIIFGRNNPSQKVASVSTAGSGSSESYYDHLSSKRLELLTLVLKLYDTKRKLGEAKVNSKIGQIMKWKVD